jgi:hypothetical protein
MSDVLVGEVDDATAAAFGRARIKADAATAYGLLPVGTYELLIDEDMALVMFRETSTNAAFCLEPPAVLIGRDGRWDTRHAQDDDAATTATDENAPDA